LSGWDEGFLQNALNTCTNGSGDIRDCPLFDINMGNGNSCQYTPPRIAAVENCGSPRTSLCGRNGQNTGHSSPAPVAPAAPASPPPAVAPAAPAITPQAVNEAYGAPTLNNAVQSQKAKVIYETVTEEDWATTTAFDKRSLRTGIPTTNKRRRRHAKLMHHHHRAHGPV
jgi:hypothetical protein